MNDERDESVRVRACLATVDVPDANGRVFPRSVLSKIVEDGKLKRRIAERACVGGFQVSKHHSRPLDLRDVAFIVKELGLPEDKLVAEIEVLVTPKGKQLSDLLNRGFQVMFVPVGVGPVVDGVVQDDYELRRVDAHIKGNPNSSWFTGLCRECGYRVVVTQPDWKRFPTDDYWWYCSNKKCSHHQEGEHTGDMEHPDWVDLA